MKHILSLLLLISTIFINMGCNNNSEISDENVEDSAKIKTLSIQMTNFTRIPKSDVIIFPLIMEEQNSATIARKYKSEPKNNYWNIVFYNTKDMSINPLSSSKILVLDFSVRELEKALAPEQEYIFYKVIDSDYNLDEVFNESDDVGLYVSDKRGSNFIRISPSKYQLLNYEYVPQSNTVIMNLKADSDTNEVFDDTDEITTFRYNLSDSVSAMEIFSDEYKSKLKEVFDNNWRRKQ